MSKRYTLSASQFCHNCVNFLLKADFQRKGFAHVWSNLFPVRVDPFSEGIDVLELNRCQKSCLFDKI